MSQPPSLRIDSAHVARQFARRSPLDAAQFLYGEVAQRMLQRLSYIRIAPVDVLDAGCGAGHALEPLRARYPQLDYIGLDSCQPLLDAARERYAAKPGFWQKLRNKPTRPVRFVRADLADSGLEPESLDLVWSNMALHWHPEPHNVLGEWRRILKPGALVMFSCLGPGSLAELRSAVLDAGLKTATPQFVDMHDFGDLLIQRGFADPVMDQEILTLTYRTPEKLLEDMHVLGGNPSQDRKPGLSGRRWRQRLLDALEAQRNADGTIHLSLEVAYGHAWRAAAHRGAFGETRISVGSIGRAASNDGTRPTVRPRKTDES
ncbi:methyltransferase domain-containing protein [Pollutimonas sp. M17]|uniref:methyltransferase domain-containing protein n=1 Tax=Pollutimonas sp. M17 TaxID=2962065 RepID=UPI0021F3D66F|nr:methyltransferase domain-containing protein [Pollutimonas sp. M17]UYO93436.1 methyltransferase domain-containing protein [Pollutimonas sp. M17]HWK71768.1 methyltransferase domain-containing protein [Burkholderiaceae bacterium]